MMISKFKAVTQLIQKSWILPTLLLTISFTSHAEEQALDGIAAIVNSDVIMVSELRAEAQQVKSQQKTDLPQQQLLKEVLEKMIMDKIQVQKAISLGIKIDDAAVDAAMQTIAKQNNLNLQQLRVALIKRGMNYRAFRESIRDKLYTDNLRRRQQGRNNTLGENEVDDLIRSESFNISKNVQYQMIDITLPNNTQSVQQFNANLQKARNLRKILLRNSTLNSSAITKMGATAKDLGWQDSASLSPAYSRALSLMGEGEFSTVIRDTQGFHILKLVKQRGGKRQKTQEARVRHILISNNDPQAKLKITQLRNQILAGANFAQLATKFSADKGSAVEGGELPMANTAKYVPEFAAAANTLALNTISQPIKTQFGWHILEVLERRNSDKTREAIKDQAKNLVDTKNRQEDVNNWLKTLREEAFVEYRIKL